MPRQSRDSSTALLDPPDDAPEAAGMEAIAPAEAEPQATGPAPPAAEPTPIVPEIPRRPGPFRMPEAAELAYDLRRARGNPDAYLGETVRAVRELEQAAWSAAGCVAAKPPPGVPEGLFAIKFADTLARARDAVRRHRALAAALGREPLVGELAEPAGPQAHRWMLAAVGPEGTLAALRQMDQYLSGWAEHRQGRATQVFEQGGWAWHDMPYSRQHGERAGLFIEAFHSILQCEAVRAARSADRQDATPLRVRATVAALEAAGPDAVAGAVYAARVVAGDPEGRAEAEALRSIAAELAGVDAEVAEAGGEAGVAPAWLVSQMTERRAALAARLAERKAGVDDARHRAATDLVDSAMKGEDEARLELIRLARSAPGSFPEGLADALVLAEPLLARPPRFLELAARGDCSCFLI